MRVSLGSAPTLQAAAEVSVNIERLHGSVNNANFFLPEA
jgi:hypothetical protein